jgi:molybdopterin converting factor small subunit
MPAFENWWMMKVTVSLFGEYRKYAPEREFALELPEGATPLAVADRLGIPRTASLWALVDGRRAPVDAALRDGSAVSLFQPVGGG